MDIPWSQVAAFAAAALSAVAAAGSWMAARRANATAATMARIEHERWRIEIAPKFRFSLADSIGQAKLVVHLEGPDALGHLDEVAIRVIDDDMNHDVLNPNAGLTQEEVDAHIWGPFRFSPHAYDADVHGRQLSAVPMQVGKGRICALERTRPGHWMADSPDRWQDKYAGHPIRLVLTCRRGDDEWVVTEEIENPPQ